MKFIIYTWIAGFSGFVWFRLGLLLMRHNPNININLKENLKKGIAFASGVALLFESLAFMESSGSTIYTIIALMLIVYSFFFSKDYLE